MSPARAVVRLLFVVCCVVCLVSFSVPTLHGCANKRRWAVLRIFIGVTE